MSDRLLKLDSGQEVRLLLSALESVGDSTVVSDRLKKKLSMALRYFKDLEKYDTIKQAAAKRNQQRRKDGRG